MRDCDDAVIGRTPGMLWSRDLASDMTTCAGVDPDQDDFPNPDPFPEDDKPQTETSDDSESRSDP